MQNYMCQLCSLTAAHSWRDGHSINIKFLWGVGSKDQSSNLYNEALHTYTLS